MIMPRTILLKRLGIAGAAMAAAFSLAVGPAAAIAARPGTAASDSTAATSDAKTQARLKQTISRGDKEIDRRLKTLNTLSIKITGAKKLSSASKTSLNNEVKAEISALNELKKKLDADTDLATAQADAKQIFSGYRVYALIVPKIQLIKTADGQQVTIDKLNAIAGKLQSRVDTAKQQGKDVATLQSALDDLKAKTAEAQSISKAVEAAVIDLQPTDYNSDYSVLRSQRDKLKTAQADIKAAAADARTVVNGLK
jgi:vacuolar-type H+-ATPase subunit I/STV1